MRYFVGDFESTPYIENVGTEVWASAIVELYKDNVIIANCIEDTWDYLCSFDEDIIVYYHNLKFDGSFWINFLYSIGYKEYTYTPKYKSTLLTENIGRTPNIRFSPRMRRGTFTYMISAMGLWYNIRVRTPINTIEFRDSLKLLPMSVEVLGKSFGTKHKKAVDEHGRAIEYTKMRRAHGIIESDEANYIRNDVLVVKEAIEVMFNEGHDKMTIGSCCMAEYKPIYEAIFAQKIDNAVFDIMSKEVKIGSDSDFETWKNMEHGDERDRFYMTKCYTTVYEYVRESYRGGWTYLAKGSEQQVIKNGITLDVNSLYPSVMHSDLNTKYPVKYINSWNGNYIPDEAIGDDVFYFIRIRTRFYLKEGYLPTIQIKRNFLYPPRDMLESSDVYDSKADKYYRYKFPSGEDVPIPVLTLTEMDYKLFLDHYNVEDFEILDGVWFEAKVGIFDEYINKYAEMKRNATTPGRRSIAKLYLNNLYGKMATSVDSSFKMCYLKDGALAFNTIKSFEKKPGYIPIGSAITSYARCFTIRAAQQNYHGAGKPGFRYADTDSLHMDVSPEDVNGVTIDDKAFGCWKLENKWDIGYFVRAKTYIEISNGEYDIKCAGLPKRSKKLLEMSLTGTIDELFPFEDGELEFAKEKRKITDFKPGIEIPGKLLPRQVPGGVVLEHTTFKMT